MTDRYNEINKNLTARQHAYWSNKAHNIQPNLTINYVQFKDVVVEGKTESCGLSYIGFDVAACVARITKLEQELNKCLNKLGWNEREHLHSSLWKRNRELRTEISRDLYEWQDIHGGE
mgnify:FL=1|tara:strand:- start:10080 stop:10433 length:354 start_codon:yes stop_codon:yes gene_type:complete